MRDQLWLEQRLEQIWHLLFSDTPQKNRVRIRFKGRWKNKFGHIKRLPNKDTEIAINGLFKDFLIPEYVVDITIAHELTHYAHGFHSPLPQLYQHPHKGGVVTRELRKRGFGHLLRKEKYFMKKEWPVLYEKLKED